MSDKLLRIESNKSSQSIGFNSKALKSTMDQLGHGRKKLKKLDSLMRKTLNIESGRIKKITVSTLRKVIPTRVKNWLPDNVTHWIASETDILDAIEQGMRGNVTDIQESLINLSHVADLKREELSQLEADLSRAKEEGWTMQQLYAYMADRSNLEIHNEVKNFLDTEFELMSEDERENSRQKIFQHLDRGVENGKIVLELMSKAGRAGLHIFGESVQQLYSFVLLAKPTAAIRDSALALADTNMTIFAGQETILTTLKEAMEILDTAIDASKMIAQCSLNSQQMRAELQVRSQKIDEKLIAARNTLPEPRQIAEAV